jgi:penicillin-binding protein 1A
MANKPESALPLQPRRGKGHPFRLFFLLVGTLILIGCAGTLWIFYQDLTGELPAVERLADYVPPAVTHVYADDGTLIGEFYLEKRYPVPLSSIPPTVQQAFIAAEDEDFYKHRGMNPAALMRAFITNWQAGQTVQGGSTITQQVVKSLLLTPERSYRRKIQEIILALRLERHMSKAQILSLYLNQIYLGSGAYGVEAAAREYFNKHVEDLSLPEVALIAGLAPAPSAYSPHKNFEEAKLRQRYVLERMIEERYVPYALAMDAWQQPLSFSSPPPLATASLAPYYVEHIRQFLEKRYGGKTNYQVGLEVHSTVNLPLQWVAEKALRDGIDALCQRKQCQYKEASHPEGALIAIDLTSGQVKAMVGGYDFNQSQFNRVTQAKRQPGSAFKPLVYAAALDNGYTPASIVLDSPVSYRDRNRWWSPKNYDRRYRGPIRLREALTFSRNVPTVRIAAKLGLPYLTSYISRLGIMGPLAHNLSLALGTSEVTMLELARAYGVFATGGMLFEPLFITKITDSQGSLVNEFTFEGEQVISPETAYLTTSMLESVIQRGTGKVASALGRPAAGKTGTSSSFQDAWFMGYTPEMLTGVWIGFDEKHPLGNQETGGHIAAPIWLDFMQQALGNTPVNDFVMPEGITFAHINPRNGKRVESTSGKRAILECFAGGTEPQLPSPPPPVEFAAAPTQEQSGGTVLVLQNSSAPPLPPQVFTNVPVMKAASPVAQPSFPVPPAAGTAPSLSSQSAAQTTPPPLLAPRREPSLRHEDSSEEDLFEHEEPSEPEDRDEEFALPEEEPDDVLPPEEETNEEPAPFFEEDVAPVSADPADSAPEFDGQAAGFEH